MKIELQVCSYAQAKKLNELGIEPADTFLHWMEVGLYDSEGQAVTDRSAVLVCVDSKGDYQKVCSTILPPECMGADMDFVEVNNFYSAFTVAELGVMLPAYFYLVRNTFMGGQWGMSHTEESVLMRDFGMIDTDEYIIKEGAFNEAEARADLLIHLIEMKKINPTDINTRLTTP